MKETWEMTAAELQTHYETCPEFEAKWDKWYSAPPISNYGLYHSVYIKAAHTAGKVIPPGVWAEANPKGKPESRAARLQGPPR